MSIDSDLSPQSGSVEADEVLVIGDSHAMFWTGLNDLNITEGLFPKLTIKRIGPVTAMSLISPRCSVHREIETVLQAKPGRIGLIVTSFGEVDIRAHIIGLALLRKCSLDEILAEIARNYLRFVDELYQKYAIPIVIWGPPPSRPYGAINYNRAVPVVGTAHERNYATAQLTTRLAAGCAERAHVAFASLFATLVGADLRTLPTALFDNCHISNAYLVEATQEMNRALDRLGLTRLQSCFRFGYDIEPQARVVDISSICRWSINSLRQDDTMLLGDLQSAFHVVEITSQYRAGHPRLLEVLIGDPDRLVVAWSAPEDDAHSGEPLLIPVELRRPQRFYHFRFESAITPRHGLDIAFFAMCFTNTLR